MKKTILIITINLMLFVLSYLMFSSIIEDYTFITINEDELISDRTTFLLISIGILTATLMNALIVYLILRVFSHKRQIMLIIMFTLLLFIISALLYEYEYRLYLVSAIKIVLFNMFFQKYKKFELEILIISILYTLIDFFTIQAFF